MKTCPECGGTDYEETLIGFFGMTDPNTAYCKCGWKGPVVNLVDVGEIDWLGAEYPRPFRDLDGNLLPNTVDMEARVVTASSEAELVRWVDENPARRVYRGPQRRLPLKAPA